MAWKGTFSHGYSWKNEYGLQFVWQYFLNFYSLQDNIRLKLEPCYVQYIQFIYYVVGSGVALWLRRCANSRTVPGSIPDGVTRFFNYIFPSDRTMVLGSTQPLVKMSTRNISWG
jgi:hypothetical protein